jgi:prephenate dehydrogenase
VRARSAAPPRRVLILGAGLIGTSIALALRERGHHVWLADVKPEHLRQAEELGAGSAHQGEPVDVTVVAVPPGNTAQAVVQRLEDDERGIVTDTASIKLEVQRDVERLLDAPSVSGHSRRNGVTRYVGGHPLAGRERGGPQRAHPAMFAGRAWVLTPDADVSPDALERARWLVTECGATPVTMSAAEHDDALAVTSHLPQLVASALAARLAMQPDAVLQLTGQALRDMTRIAAADPALWADIATGNARPVADAIDGLTASLHEVAAALRADPADPQAVSRLVELGGAGHSRLPGKHGGVPRSYQIVPVVVPDQPGQLARLLGDAAASGVNVEDLRVEHAPGLPVGVIELFVGPESAGVLRAALGERGWTLSDAADAS